MSASFVGGRCLGKRAPKHDPRTYRLGRVLAVRLPAVPDARDWSQSVPYQMWGNDRFGCCAFAAHAALVATWTKAAQSLVMLSTETVLANYAALTGFNAETGYDPGTILLDELNVWRRNGLLRPGQTRDYLTAYGSIAPTDVVEVVSHGKDGLKVRMKDGREADVEWRRLKDHKTGRILLGFGHAMTVDFH